MYNNAAAPASRGGSPTGVASLSSELQVLNFGLVTSWSMASARMPEGGARRERAKGLALPPFARSTPRPSDHGTRGGAAHAPRTSCAENDTYGVAMVSNAARAPCASRCAAAENCTPERPERQSIWESPGLRDLHAGPAGLVCAAPTPWQRRSPLTARRPWPEPTTSAPPSAEPARRRRLSLAPGSSPAAPRWSGIAGW